MRNKENYYKMYIEKGMSTRDIAKELGIGQTTVRKDLKKFEIETRKGLAAKQTDYYKKKMQPYWESLEKKEERACLFCGKNFITRPHEKRKYCSVFCAQEASRKRGEEERRANRIQVPCSYCGKILERIPSRVKSCTNHFCNHSCHGKWKSINLIGENNPGYNRIARSCTYCGKTILVIPSRNKQKLIYCNQKCMAKDYRESGRFSGSNNLRWKGGKLSYGANWLAQRDLVRKRDQYVCQRCGKTEEENEEELSVHHITPFRLFSSFENANQENNLVSLCRECHTFVHSKNNVLNEFINHNNKDIV